MNTKKKINLNNQVIANNNYIYDHIENSNNQNYIREHQSKFINPQKQNKSLSENQLDYITNSTQSTMIPTKTFHPNCPSSTIPQSKNNPIPTQRIISIENFKEIPKIQLPFPQPDNFHSNHISDIKQNHCNQIISKVITFSKKKNSPQIIIDQNYENSLTTNAFELENYNSKGNLKKMFLNKESNFFPVETKPPVHNMIYYKKKSSDRGMGIRAQNNSSVCNTNRNSKNKISHMVEQEKIEINLNDLNIKGENKSKEINDIKNNNVNVNREVKGSDKKNTKTKLESNGNKITNKGVKNKKFITVDINAKGVKEKAKNNMMIINTKINGIESGKNILKIKRSEQRQMQMQKEKNRENEEINKALYYNEENYNYYHNIQQSEIKQNDNINAYGYNLQSQENVTPLSNIVNLNINKNNNNKDNNNNNNNIVQQDEQSISHDSKELLDSFLNINDDFISFHKKTSIKSNIPQTPPNYGYDNKPLQTKIDKTHFDTNTNYTDLSKIIQPFRNYDSYSNISSNITNTNTNQDYKSQNSHRKTNSTYSLQIEGSLFENININKEQFTKIYNPLINNSNNNSQQNINIKERSQTQMINKETHFSKYQEKKKVNPFEHTPIIQIDLTSNNQQKDDMKKTQSEDKDLCINLPRSRSKQEYQRPLNSFKQCANLTQGNRDSSYSKDKKYQLIYDYEKIAKEIEIDSNYGSIRPRSRVEQQSRIISKLLSIANNFPEQNNNDININKYSDGEYEENFPPKSKEI